MRRLVAALFVALLLAWPVRWASAHELALFGHLSVDAQGEVAVRIVDVYGVALEGQKVTAFATAPGGRPTRTVELAEGPAGTYRGVVTVPGEELYQVTIDLVLAGDLHRIVHNVRSGEAQPERMVPMAAIDPPEGIPWSRILFALAAVVLVAGTAVALRKQRPDPQEGA